MPAVAAAQGNAAPSSQTFLDFEVERPARGKDVSAPAYPAHLRSQKIEGEVLVQFVVTENGSPEMSTFKVLKATDNGFVDAVKRAVSSSTFHAAQYEGRNVKQLVQLPFRFKAGK